ncbi:VOC family protein [Actinopolymorpha alba]|uniref:VOC family protein n=1 Tax=Actinopolymorpha alba TaxID=533267 RepID=UPI000382863A|nr:VOC family protein [Actinopolymorpha alba]
MGTVAFDGIIIFCADVAASAEFYEGALGLFRESADGDVTLHLPTKGDPQGAWILLHPRHDGMPVPHAIGTFAVDDVDSTIERLRSAGHRISSEPADQPWGVREAGVLDPDGYELTLTASLQPSDS